ncbi:type I restriction enzyme HsdR N-terminal domain-containing protein [Cardinium endosymbiont of Tipula unca]|uniref:type I restriction enzyme HsdR N-terminal domain-containing protein n=1 Tax=Cardinium endosymbiont of Tipula unca TaxID=3066216 RepID=UPI0030CFBB69
MMPLALPAFSYKTKYTLGKIYILDLLRKKYLLLTQEEWVRQHMLNYLMHHLHYPKGLFRLEKKINDALGCYRPDIVLFDRLGRAKIIVECKAPNITLTHRTLKQIMHYNSMLTASILVITNGITHFCWELEQNAQQFKPMDHIPSYQESKPI